jgi:hypothetical protein
MTTDDELQTKRPACMGGWCHKRDICRHHDYHADVSRDWVVDRLCSKGTTDQFSPIIVAAFSAWIAASSFPVGVE